MLTKKMKTGNRGTSRRRLEKKKEPTLAET
jgi:hypothetical protein